MAVKHVVTDGIGFTVPSYLLTEGIGNFTVAGGGGAAPEWLGRQGQWVEPVQITDGQSIVLGIPYLVQPLTVTTT